MAIGHFARESVCDFSDPRVVLTLNPSIASALGGHIYSSQRAGGPTRVYLSRAVSDGTLAKMADRHGLALDELRAFRDHSSIGTTMLATPAAALLV
jgi:hypothetical protein